MDEGEIKELQAENAVLRAEAKVYKERSRAGLIIVAAVACVAAVVISTYVLYQQNKVMEREDSLTAFEKTVEFRERMGGSSRKDHSSGMWLPPNQAVVSQFVILGRAEAEITLPAVRPLFKDVNHQVSATAALIIYEFDRELSEAELSEANLPGADLSGADLRGADLSEANLRGADLSGADLRGADLRGADLNAADMSKASLNKTNLSGANLSEANLSRADLRGADLHGANLSESNLSGAKLNGARLNGADLHRSNLDGANLHKANLHKANLSSVRFWNKAKSWKRANIHGVSNPPEGFRTHVLSNGGIKEGP